MWRGFKEKTIRVFGLVELQPVARIEYHVCGARCNDGSPKKKIADACHRAVPIRAANLVSCDSIAHFVAAIAPHRTRGRLEDGDAAGTASNGRGGAQARHFAKFATGQVELENRPLTPGLPPPVRSNPEMSLKRRHVSRGDGRPNQRIETGILARATESRRTLTDIICHGGDEGCGASFGHGRVRASRIAAKHGVFSLDLDERGRGWAVGAVRNRVLGGFASCLWARSLRPWERRRPWPPALAQATVSSGWCRGRSQPRGDAPPVVPIGPW